MPKLHKNGGSYRLTIAKEEVEMAGWQEGDRIYCTNDGRGNIVLKNMSKD